MLRRKPTNGFRSNIHHAKYLPLVIQIVRGIIDGDTTFHTHTHTTYMLCKKKISKCFNAPPVHVFHHLIISFKERDRLKSLNAKYATSVQLQTCRELTSMASNR